MTDDSLDLRIAANLRAARHDAGLTQRDVEKRLGVTQQTVSGWERGLNLPSVPHLAALIRLYGCTADDIFGLLRNDTELSPKQILRQLERALEQDDQADR